MTSGRAHPVLGFYGPDTMMWRINREAVLLGSGPAADRDAADGIGDGLADGQRGVVEGGRAGGARGRVDSAGCVRLYGGRALAEHDPADGARSGQEVVEVRAVRLPHVDVQGAAGARDPQQLRRGRVELGGGDRVRAAGGDGVRRGRLEPAQLGLVEGRELPSRAACPSR